MSKIMQALRKLALAHSEVEEGIAFQRWIAESYRLAAAGKARSAR